MSTEPFEPFFLEIPWQYFHCQENLYNVRDNLCIEVATSESSFMTKGPALLLSGIHVRITNRTKENKGVLRTEIRIDPWVKLDIHELRINSDYADIRQKLGENCPYPDNQVCCAAALLGVFMQQSIALRFEAKRKRLVLLINDYDYPSVDLSPFKAQWLAIQTPGQQPRTDTEVVRSKK